MILLKETDYTAITANDSLVLLLLDRITNAPVALEIWPDGYESEEMRSSSYTLILGQFGLGRAKTIFMI
jgi:hypothetical protein